MSDTIDLLETIGRDAALRHASVEELVRVLDQEEASEAFRIAVESGDISRLFTELGCSSLQVDHTTQTPGYEEDAPAEEEDAPDPIEPERS